MTKFLGSPGYEPLPKSLLLHLRPEGALRLLRLRIGQEGLRDCQRDEKILILDSEHRCGLPDESLQDFSLGNRSSSREASLNGLP